MTSRRVLRWLVWAVLVVGLVAAIRVLDRGQTVERDGLTFAADDLARVLGGGESDTDTRIVAAFVGPDGVPCRAFLSGGASGIACRERGGWHLRVIRSGVSLDDPVGTARTEQALRRAASAMAAQ